MDRANVARTLIEMQNHVENVTQEAVGSLCSEFKKSENASNVQANHEYDMHNLLATHLVVSTLNQTYTKAYDSSKKRLDEKLTDMEVDSSVNSGESRVLYKDNSFNFEKTRHKSGESISLDDFKIELVKAGIEDEVIQHALKEASRTKPGKVFYDIEPV